MLRMVIITLFVMTQSALAQSLTPEQILEMVNERVAKLNPYKELLSDPDPERSLAALEIMMESGDKVLMRMALEYGLLSTQPTVKRAALESFIKTQPTLIVELDGSGVKAESFRKRIKSSHFGNVSADLTGYWRIPVGEYNEPEQCFKYRGEKKGCVVAITSDGLFLTAKYISARGTVGATGSIEGNASLYKIDEAVPFSIQLLD